MKEENGKRVIRSGITRRKLAALYMLDAETITAWFKDIDVTHSKTLKPKEIARFVRAYGLPDNCKMRIPYDHPLNQ
jgi:2-polyprenyl-3-methyl-5-hydroxy-6-metoxy-1,4-benzoquinol methylase